MIEVVGESVVIQTGTEVTDRYDNVTFDWTDPAEVTVDGVAVAPRHEGEDLGDGRLGVVIGYQLYLPPGTVVGPHNRIVVRGDVCEVDGEPGEWHDPYTGWSPGIEVAVRRVEG